MTVDECVVTTPLIVAVAEISTLYVPAGVGVVVAAAGAGVDEAHPQTPGATTPSITTINPASLRLRGNTTSSNPASTTPDPAPYHPPGRGTLVACALVVYASSEKFVLPLAVALTLTGFAVNDVCAASVFVELAVSDTLPANPSSELTVNTTAGAMLPPATVTFAVIGVSAKSGVPAAVIAIANAPFDPANVPSPK